MKKNLDKNLNEIKKISLRIRVAREAPCDLHEKKKKACKPSKGKRFAKRVKGKCRSFGQKGKAKDGGDRIRPGTKKGDAYCARSFKIKKCKNPPCANALSRKKWKCRGKKSVNEAWRDPYEDAPSDSDFADEARVNKLTKIYVESLLPHAQAILLRIIGVGSDLPGEPVAPYKQSFATEEFVAELAELAEGEQNLDVMEFLLRSVGESIEDITDPDRYGDL